MDEAVNPADWGDKPAEAVPVAAASASPADWGDKPVESTQPKGFWETLTHGGAEGMLKETLPAALITRQHDVREATTAFNAEGAWDKERKRRIAAGESTNGMENWKLAEINRRVQETKPEAPTPAFKEIMSALGKQATEDPGGFAGGLVRGIITAPELLFMPEALPLRMAELAAKVGKTAGVTAKVGTEAAQIGAAAAGESVAKQLAESGTTNPAQVGADALMVAAPMVAIKSGVALLRKAGKTIDEADVSAKAAEGIRKGESPTDSVLDALKKYWGLSPDQAEQIRTAVVPYEKGAAPSGKAELSTDQGKSWMPYAAGAVTAGAAAVGYGQMDEDQRKQALLLGMTTPLWYSPLAKTIFTKLPAAKDGTIKPDQMTNWVEARVKDGTISKEELQYSGLPEWLKLQTGPVSKADIDGYLRQNGVQVEETTLGQEPNLSVSSAKEILGRGGKVFAVDRNNEEMAAIATLDDKKTLLPYIEKHPERFYLREGDIDRYDRRKIGTKFSSYQLPGGENYRELLLTLPTKEGETEYVVRNRADQVEARGYSREESERIAKEIGGKVVESAKENRPAFQSSHYDQPNVLAHIRFNERTDADGKRVLFIEEIQSDWAQKGRKDGFAGESGFTSDKEARFNELNKLASEGGRRGMGPELWAEYKALDELRSASKVEIRKGSPPAAPFVGKTEAWTALAIKRMIRYAADNGFDRVAWTTGEQQAARYSLDKHVESVTAKRNSEGTYELGVTLKDGQLLPLSRLSESALADHVGKELAQKIVEQTAEGSHRAHFSNLDLKIGGEGQRGFYDKIIPNVANDVLKKLGGGRVGEVPIELSSEMREWRNNYEGPTPTPEQLSIVRRAVNAGPRDSRAHPLTGQPLEWIVNRASNKSAIFHIEREMQQGKTFKQAIEENGTNEVAELFGGKMTPDHGTGVRGQPGFDITPAMKAKAGKPMSPFRQEGRIDAELLKMLGLAGLGAAGAYILTGDRDKAIAAAVAMGSLPLAKTLARKVGVSVGQATKVLSDKRINPVNIWHDFQAGVRVPEYMFKQWQKSTEALLPKMRGAERDASHVRIRDYVQGHRDVPLSAHEMAAAAEVKKFLDNVYDIGQRGDVLHSYLENYLPGLYQKKPFANWTDIINQLMQEERGNNNIPGMRPKTRHAMEKIIPDYRTVESLIAQGKLDLIPLTKNPMEMARIAGNAVNKAVQVKKMLTSLKELRDGTGTPMVVGNSPTLTVRAIEDAIAAAGTQLGATRAAQKLWADYDIQQATKDYVSLNHPSLLGLKVHKDLVGPMRMLFDTGDPRSLTNAVYGLSMAHKSLLFSMSLFHASTLAAVQAPMIMGRGAAMLLSGIRPSVLKQTRNAWEANAGKQLSPIAARMLETGATLGHGIQDVDPSFMQRIFNFVQQQVGQVPGVGPILSGAVAAPKFLHHKVSSFIFDQLQPTFKMATWMAEDQQWRKKNPNATAAQTEAAHRQISEGVNVLYGGLNWFELANNVDSRIGRSVAMAMFAPGGRKFQQIALLAPDWNIAALRAWTQGIKAANPMMSEKASDGLYRTYLVASALVYLGMAEALQQHYTGQHIWDQEDWTNVNRGDGTKIQLNKHFMEAVHLYHDPSRFVLGKLGYVPSQIAEQLASAEYVTHKDGKFIAPPMQDNRIFHALKRFFTPITVSGIRNPEQLIAGNLGMQIGGKSYEDAARERIEKRKKREEAAKGMTQEDKEAAAKKRKERADYMNKVRDAERRIIQ